MEVIISAEWKASRHVNRWRVALTVCCILVCILWHELSQSVIELSSGPLREAVCGMGTALNLPVLPCNDNIVSNVVLSFTEKHSGFVPVNVICCALGDFLVL